MFGKLLVSFWLFKHYKHVRLIWNNIIIKVSRVIGGNYNMNFMINEIFIQVMEKSNEEL
jgi:hypothetical protein